MRYNILLIAHEISPIQGSECAQGWNIAIRLSKFNNITVIYASGSQFNPKSYKNEINKVSFLYPNIEFINVDQTKFGLVISWINKLLFGKFSPIGNPLLYYFVYNLWQRKAFSLSQKIIKKNKIDLIHLITSISFREPGYFWKLNLPFIWGPTGGLTTLPDSFLNTLTKREKFLEKIRTKIINYEFSSNNIKNAIINSTLIYTFSEFDRLNFINSGAKQVINLLDSGSTYLDLPIKEPSDIIQVVWAGQLVKRKSFNILLDAVLKLPDSYRNKFKFKILGNGILLDFYKDKVRKFGLSNYFIFDGHKNRDQLFDILKDSDILVHTSYREATTNIIPEALSTNLPVICHDISGMSIAINESCGYKIPLINNEYSSNEIVKILIFFCENKNILIKLKKGAKQRSKEISWDKNAEQISNNYNKILN
jgi:glycosyltransferase involved in cell wall biosynthesis